MTDYSHIKATKENKPSGCFCCCCKWILKLFVFLVIIVVICAAALVIWKFAQGDPELTPVIMTLDGPIQGNIQYSRDGQEYWQFLGIPYAKPPEGELLYQPPVPVEPWEDVKQVTSYPRGCAQYEVILSLKTNGVMDCLYLNVFSNVANGNTSKPVLVYIHGGGFMSGGSKIYQPDYFMDHNVVLVVMNYRLGPFGFLNLKGIDNPKGEKIPQGNMGLMDQNLVLQWIQKNIDSFGGDPNSVTVFGESAGATSTHLHVLSPMSRGLFHKALLQSGNAISPSTFSGKPKEIAIRHAKLAGCHLGATGDEGLLDCYKSTNWEELVKHQYSLVEPLQEKDLFVPTVDGTFLKEMPEDTLKSGDYPPIPIMFGVNSGEGGIRSARFDALPELIPVLDKNWTDVIQNLFLLDNPVPPNVSMELREHYFGNSSFTEDNEGFMENLTLLLSDGGFFYPAHLSAVYHAKNLAPTYMHFFNYTSHIYPGFYSVMSATRVDDWLSPRLRIWWSMGLDWVTQYIFGGIGSRVHGISHGEGAFQLWNLQGATKFVSSFDSEFSHGFVKSIVDFANDTNPLTFRGVEWPSINNHLTSGKDEYSIPYMLMDNEDVPKVISDPFHGRLQFWTDLRERFNWTKY